MKLDKVVQDYNEVYFKPAKAKLDELYEKGLLDKTRFFDEQLEVEYYELWHHEGRRARMGAAMMAPDYSWWHGFYECKKRYVGFMEEANHLIETNTKAYIATDFPNATGGTAKPVKSSVNQSNLNKKQSPLSASAGGGLFFSLHSEIGSAR